MKLIYILLLTALTGLSLFSQNDPRIARTKTPLSEIERVVMPLQNNEALLADEMARRSPGIAPRFAVNLETDISPGTHGQWEYLANGNAVWRLRIYSQGAKSLNLGFTQYVMPHGGTLILYSTDYQRVMGPFSPADNEEHEQLWTPVVAGDELVIEVQLPNEEILHLQLQLKYVNHDFLGFTEILSGSCNLDVICGAANGWAIVDAYRDIIQSVAVIGQGGGTFCTGFLVNNARQDCTPFFMTANHCGFNSGNAATFVGYWNYFNSTCRQPNSPASGANGNGMLNDFNTGAIFRAGWGTSDFTLLELDDPVSENADAFYAGWSAEDFPPTDTVICIHHPNTQEKRISFEFNPTHIGVWPGNNMDPNGNHVIVPDWDIGTTEGGSSGSPLFNRQKRVVGQLHGGGAACGNNEYDSFGWFHSSWEGGGTPSTRLRDWLDPDNTGIVVLDGRSQMQCDLFVEATPANVELCAPEDAIFSVSVSDNFTDSVYLSLSGLPDSLTLTFETNPLPPGGSTVLTISNTGTLSAGNYLFNIEATDSLQSTSIQLSLSVTSQAAQVPSLLFPANGATGVVLSVTYSWDFAPNTTYLIEIATDPTFANVVESAANLEEGSYQANVILSTFTTYYWRVKAFNVCGESDWSLTSSFTTGAIFCLTPVSTAVPVPISSSGQPEVTSTIQVNIPGIINDVNVSNVDITHTWVGDLRIRLTSPEGTTIMLMTNPAGGDCEGDNLSVGFDDQSNEPYAALDAMCETGPLAISGLFQPFELLSAFNGESAQGTWTLTVNDDASQDGGILTNWALEICSSAPSNFSVTPTIQGLQSCVGADTSFTVLLGSAFDPLNGVTLSAENLPPGVTATFDPNPAQPGAIVNVTLSGAMAVGNFTFDVVATDGTNSAQAQIPWTVIGGPTAPSPVFPIQFQENVSVSPTISWTPSPGSTYLLEVATDPNMNEIVFSETTSNTSLLVPGLDFCTTYYWTVTADNGCGEAVLEVFTFTTLPDLSFNVVPGSVSSCHIGQALTALTVGQCFETSGVTLSASGLPAGAAIEYSVNPAQPGAVIGITVLLNNAAPGSYVVTIEGNDGTNTVTETFNLTVNGPAPAPIMVFPANNATDVDLTPTFDWNPVTGALNYKIEVATDENFNNIIISQTTTLSSFTPSTPLELETTYFWRVTAFNNCGGATPALFSFTTEGPGAAHETGGVIISLQPNPTGGLTYLTSSGTLPEGIEVEVFSIHGIRLQHQRLAPGYLSAKLDLSGYPAGVYLVKLATGETAVTERVILKK